MADIKHRYTGMDKIEVAKLQLKPKDLFSMNYSYELMREWLLENEYVTRYDEDFPETFYLQKENPVAGTEIWIHWRCRKKPAGSSFFRYDLDIDMHILGLKATEIVKDGNKYKANTGEIEINIRANLVMDPDGTWKKHWFLKSIYPLFRRRVINKLVEKKRKELYEEAYKFEEALKTYFKLENFLPEPEMSQFWQKRDLSNV